MNKELESNSDTSVKVVNLIDFHGLTMWVVENQGINYIQVKPLADMANVDWRGAKKAVFNADNAILYATKKLNMPVFVVEGGDITPLKTAICIRLDRSRMYLARIDTSRMRAHGKVEAANDLLTLQIEWAEALDKYESNGVAYKNNRGNLKDLCGMLKTLSKPRQDSINLLIDRELAEMGVPVNHSQKGQGELAV